MVIVLRIVKKNTLGFDMKGILMKFYLPILMVIMLSSASQALTLKKGQVIGGDGSIHDGASPEMQEQLIKNAQKTDFFGNKKGAGVVGGNLFVIVDDEAVFVPLSELAGKSKEGLTNVVREYIVSHLVTNMTAKHIAEEGSIDKETLEQFESMDIANDEVTQQIANEVSEFAKYDIEKATAVLEASLNLATVDAANNAAREAAESAFEQAFEAANEVAAEAYDAVHGEGAYCEQDPNCEVWTPDSE